MGLETALVDYIGGLVIPQGLKWHHGIPTGGATAQGE